MAALLHYAHSVLPHSETPRTGSQDFSDPDTQLSVAGVVLGLVLGLGAPAWYINRTERDEERLEELRALNRAQYQETGEYMTDVSARRASHTSAAALSCRQDVSHHKTCLQHWPVSPA